MPERVFDLTLPGAAGGPVARNEIYRDLRLPAPPPDRPYVVVNMVATLDGKTVVGGAGTTRLIGSETDHALMTQIEDGVDAVLLGAGLVRDDNPGYPRLSERRLAERAARGVRPEPWWIIITTQAQFAGTPRLLEENPQRVAICTTTRAPPERLRALQAHCRVLVLGEERVNPLALGRALRHELDVRSVCCLGGASLNGYLVDSGCVDEFFLTLAPKLKGSTGGTTAVEGAGFEAERMPQLDLLSLYRDGSELYLRYRLRR